MRTITEAIRLAKPGARIVVGPGTYREPTIIVDKPVVIEGNGAAVLDGEGARQIMTVAADDVTVRGLTFRNVGTSFTEDRAAIKVVRVGGCTITDNRIERGFFAIYLAGASDCRVERNVLVGGGAVESRNGNGIHLWSSRDVTIADNRVSGQRDGIYLEFSRHITVERNTSERNQRYGLHFMYSDSCRYLENTFRRNGSGVAVMYTKRVDMIGNRFEDNWGSAAFGLLLKEIADPRIERNRFARNTVGLFADGAMRIQAIGNEFVGNGWATKLMASTQDGVFRANTFVGNTFDVSTNSRETSNRFEGNYWDAYTGYDLNHDGVGDVPYHPVRLFSVVVERRAPALILLRSFFVDVIDMAERVLPVLTPEAVADPKPLMHRRSMYPAPIQSSPASQAAVHPLS